MKNKIIQLIYVLGVFIIAMLHTNTAFASENIKTINKNNVDLIILFNDNIVDKNVEDIVTNAGGKIINEFSNIGGIEVQCPAKLIPIIRSERSVQSLAPNHIIKLSNEKTSKFLEYKNDSKSISSDLYEKYQWDIKRVTNNGESFKLESGNHEVVVGIIDSGVDTSHPDLCSNFLGGKNLIPAGFQGDLSETGDVHDIEDRLGHGTNAAGTIAANGRVKGVAPNIGFKSYRVFNKNGETNATICTSAIYDATNDGVKVINLSIGAYDLKGKCYWTDKNTGIKYKLGDDMAEYSLFKRAIKYATDNGVTVVVAAGNENFDCSNKKALTQKLNNQYSDSGFEYEGLTYQSPGSIKNVITVSATDINDKLASYSNYGKKFISIAAPGGDYSKTSRNIDMCLTTMFHSGYTFVEGTSISAPKVSAVAALIICKNKDLTPKEVEKKIYKTADKLPDENSSEYYGAGIVNAYNAIQYCKY